MPYLQTSGIYGIFNAINDWVYIGQAHRFHARWQVHRRLLNLGDHHNSKLQWDWVFYSPDVFQFRVLEEMTRYEFCYQAKDREYFYMTKYFDRLYNAAMPRDILVRIK